MLLQSYRPRAQLIVESTPVEKPRLPVVEAHNHLGDPPAPVSAMLSKALMMPNVVPKRPTKGAVEPIVARTPSPRFISASLTAVTR